MNRDQRRTRATQGQVQKVQGQMHAMYRLIKDEVGERTGLLLDRYHRLHVYPLELRIMWLETPLWKRAWLTVTKRKPDLDALVGRALEEWDEKYGPSPCTAVHPSGEACVLNEHPPEVPHRYIRKVKLEGVEPVVEWFTEAEPKPDGAE